MTCPPVSLSLCDEKVKLSVMAAGVPLLLFVPAYDRFDGLPAFDPLAMGDAADSRKEREEVSGAASSLYRSHRVYREMISCAIVVINDSETFRSAKNEMGSCGFLVSGATTCRDDRRGCIVGVGCGVSCGSPV